MPLTSQYYGGRTAAPGRTMQDFGLCDLKGNHVYTNKTRQKGLMVVTFFAPLSAPSQRLLQTLQTWTETVPTDKWTAVGVTDGDRETLAKFAQERGLTGLTLLLDYELYQTRAWGITNLPTTFLIAGRTGMILDKVVGDDTAALAQLQTLLTGEAAKIVAAEAAAKKADEEKKAAEAAAKAAAKAAAAPAK